MSETEIVLESIQGFPYWRDGTSSSTSLKFVHFPPTNKKTPADMPIT